MDNDKIKAYIHERDLVCMKWIATSNNPGEKKHWEREKLFLKRHLEDMKLITQTPEERGHVLSKRYTEDREYLIIDAIKFEDDNKKELQMIREQYLRECENE